MSLLSSAVTPIDSNVWIFLWKITSFQTLAGARKHFHSFPWGFTVFLILHLPRKRSFHKFWKTSWLIDLLCFVPATLLTSLRPGGRRAPGLRPRGRRVTWRWRHERHATLWTYGGDFLTEKTEGSSTNVFNIPDTKPSIYIYIHPNDFWLFAVNIWEVRC